MPEDYRVARIELARQAPNIPVAMRDGINRRRWKVGEALAQAFGGDYTNERAGFTTRHGRYESAEEYGITAEITDDTHAMPYTAINVDPAKMTGRTVLALNAAAERAEGGRSRVPRGVLLNVVQLGGPHHGVTTPYEVTQLQYLDSLLSASERIRSGFAGSGLSVGAEISRMYGLPTGRTVEFDVRPVYQAAVQQDTPGEAAQYILDRTTNLPA